MDLKLAPISGLFYFLKNQPILMHNTGAYSVVSS